MSKVKHRLDLVIHFLLGSTLILKGLTKLPDHNVLGGLMFLFGVTVIVYFIYVLLKKEHSRVMHIIIHLFEALVSLFIAYIFFEEGKKYVQYVFILAAIGFIIAALVTSKRNEEHP